METLIPWVVLAIGGGILVCLFVILMHTQTFRRFLVFVIGLLAAATIVGALLFLPVGVYQLVNLLIFQAKLGNTTVNDAVFITAASSFVLLVVGVYMLVENKRWGQAARSYLSTARVYLSAWYRRSVQGRQ